ncbi:hypothetical protein NDU88_002484 [Pleurodeles waltl]|uniref:Uncharacterized protein n=1 Tax=Pleurodeles waltl TaxID=8319 RepID=A0AAV7VEJ1_PLEWA|nr:hypothetical protein NDU88_002484 [Pleurodeles waltl]
MTPSDYKGDSTTHRPRGATSFFSPYRRVFFPFGTSAFANADSDPTATLRVPPATASDSQDAPVLLPRKGNPHFAPRLGGDPCSDGCRDEGSRVWCSGCGYADVLGAILGAILCDGCRDEGSGRVWCLVPVGVADSVRIGLVITSQSFFPADFLIILIARINKKSSLIKKPVHAWKYHYP